MATKPTIATVAVGQKISAALWNAQVYNDSNFGINKKPVCALFQGTAQTGIASATFTPVLFDSESVDTDNQHSTTTNTSRVVIGNTPGWYRCSGQIAWGGTAAATTYRSQLNLNGSGVTGSQVILGTTGTFASSILVPTLVQAVNATDYVELASYQGSGGTMSTAVSGTFRSYFLVEYLGDLS